MQLGWELRQLREKVGFTLAEAVDGLTFSTSKLYRVENGLTGLKAAAELRILLDRYGVEDEEDVDFLVGIHRESLNRGWWSIYRNVMPSGMALYIGLESGIRSSRAWQPNVVFGLLQTENYAREMFLSSKPVHETTTEFVERHTQIRVERKKALTRRDTPLELWAIQDEAALRRVVGSPDVMREQYEEILKLAQLDNVTVQILPMATATYRSASNFSLMEFGVPLPTVVQIDAAEGTKISDKDTDVWSFSRRFEALRGAALAPVETPAFLQQLAREI
ncbi:putative DNA-binding protein [Streptomyces bingchenggensis BCW-1]|uniref:Putative DNA-binding protein n=1 Tax=Streptomyces bingchenggensis (strain BCW-1) TaxID=749414 RepID=D7BV01_STRBB|nr:helix-turn-helix transcriptional regulator [Streptomyces milbemycinicus]ADI05380.1 putative DNA-binding protein [Streptomyces bingchenggensis BCW-1]